MFRENKPNFSIFGDNEEYGGYNLTPDFFFCDAKHRPYKVIIVCKAIQEGVVVTKNDYIVLKNRKGNIEVESLILEIQKNHEKIPCAVAGEEIGIRVLCDIHELRKLNNS